MARRRRLLLAARPYDLSAAPFDAFVERNVRLVDVLLQHYDVALLLIRPSHDTAEVQAHLFSSVIADLPAPGTGTSRAERLRRAVKAISGSPPGTLEAAIGAAARTSGADRAVTLGPWLDSELEPVFSALPTLHFFEEDLTAMSEIAPQSWQAKGFRALEHRLMGVRRNQPRVTAYISPQEADAAARRYGRSRTHWHPLLLDPQKWPLAGAASTGTNVLVAGQFAQGRNAEGLRDVLDALSTRTVTPIVEVVSGAGLHPCLRPHVDSGLLRLVVDDGDLYGRYRRSALALVPARRMSGVKTTVLQAWAAGCPVVCFPASAASVGHFAYSSLAMHPSPAGVAELVVALAADPHRRQELAAAANATLREHFDADVHYDYLLDAVERLVR